MKKTIAAMAVLALAGTAMADNFSYTDMNNQGSWDRPIGVGPSISGLGPVMYHVYSWVSSGGVHDITSVQDYDGYIHLYEGSFDPLDQLTGLVAADDDGAGGIGTSEILGFNLNAGSTYFLVTSGFAAGDEGTFTNRVTPAPASMALLGLGGLVATRRRR